MEPLQNGPNDPGVPSPGGPVKPKSDQGMALFMVMAAISVLTLLVTEFVYTAQLSQSLAYDNLDQLKAHYLAKSGFKISLLRLKAFQIVKGVVGGGDSSGKDSKKGGGGAGGIPGVPKSLIDKIWSFPFMYPIPTNLPGMSPMDKERIEKFQKAANLEGSFTAVIDAESGRMNLNMILANFAPSETSPSPSPNPSAKPNGNEDDSDKSPPKSGGASPSPTPTKFNPDEARKSLQDYLQNILQRKFEEDPDFAAEYRDFRMEDFMDTLVAWADPTYERKLSGGKDQIPMKRAPFYSMTELHMLPGMDDQLYALFAPALTVARTQGVNLNTMKEPTLHALVPQMTEEEVKDFFKFRDNTEEDNAFKQAEDFFKYLSNSVVAFQRNQGALDKLKEDLGKRNVRLLVDESEFKITVQATVNKAVRTLEAWVTLNAESKNKPTSPSSGASPTPSPTPTGAPSAGPGGSPPPPDSGLKINFMRIS